MFSKAITVSAAVLLTFLASSAHSADRIEGVWELTEFKIEKPNGEVIDWCKGAHGVIIYTQGYMSTAVNCKSDPSKAILYSGPYEYNGTRVIHHARNFSHPGLNRSFDRFAYFKSENELSLQGDLDNNDIAYVSWKRR